MDFVAVRFHATLDQLIVSEPWDLQAGAQAYDQGPISPEVSRIIQFTNLMFN